MANIYSLKVVRVESVIWEANFHRRVPDLYVKVILGGVTRRTRTIKNDSSPNWNDTLTFPSSVESSTFKIELKHSSRLPMNPCVGHIDIKLDDLLARCANGEAAFGLLSSTGASVTSVGILILHLQIVHTSTSVEINLNNARADVEQCGIVRSETVADSLANITDGVNRVSVQSGLYQAISDLLSQLEVFQGFLDVHPFLTLAWQVTSILHTTVTNVFRTDKKVVGLVRTMETAFAFVRDAQTLRDKVRSLQAPIIDLLKQTMECCIFVREYTSHGFVGRMLDSTSSAKVDEFESSLADLKRAIDSGVTLHTAFVSVRMSEGVNELVLRQRLNPILNDVFYRPDCLLGTRVEVQNRIMNWLLSETHQNIFWLYGVAGSGKSTVSTTIAKRFRELSRLGAFLYFERGKSEPSTVLRTIAYQLAVFDSTIGSRIFEYKKDITTADSSTQFDELLLRPLAAAATSLVGPIVIVLDALDECGTPDSRRSLMQLFHRDFARLPKNFKILITSRREADIDKVLLSLPHLVCSMDLDYTSASSQQDVLSYLRNEMDDAVRRHVEIPKDWPWEESLELLGNTAGGLFIWASTVVKLVSNSDNPLYVLQRLVKDSNIVAGLGLGELYATVLRQSGIVFLDERSKNRFAKVMGLLLLSKVPLSSKAIDEILGFPPEEPSLLILSRLQSVLRYTPGEPVSLFHTSFFDYLMSTERSADPWFIDVSVQQHFIASRCFDVMKDMLRFNICDLETSFVCNDDVKQLEEQIKLNIPPHLEYACIYWAQHLREVHSPDLLDKLFTFTYRHLLLWFEILSLLKTFGRVANFAIRETIAWLPAQNSDISHFLQDACGLATTFASSITHSTPHIYVSMLPLTRNDSLVSAHYSIQTSSMVKVKRKGRKPRPRWTKVFEGHTADVTSVVFSPNGHYIASSSSDCTIRMWDVSTGETMPRQIIRHSDRIWSVSFSPDGKRIVSGSADKTVRVWNVHSGELALGPLEGHIGAVDCVTFSSDGAKIVSGSYDSSIRVWDAGDGRLLLGPLVEHTDTVNAVIFSHNGGLLVSGSWDKTILVWDAKTGHVVTGPLLGHSKEVTSLCFSPDGKHFASGSWDGTIRVWAMASGMVVSEIVDGRGLGVYSVAFSRDGTRIASGDYGRAIRVWDMRTATLVSDPFEGHSDVVTCVAFSPNDKSIVSCSWDKTIRLWDFDERDVDPTPSVGHNSVIFSVAVSSDGGRIVTGSDDKTIIVWNAFSGEVIKGPLKGHTEYVKSIAFSSAGTLIASGSRDRTIRVWNAGTGMVVQDPFEGHTDGVESVTFSPDDTLIASGSSDNTIRLWSASKGALVVEPLLGHTDIVNCVTFSPDSALVASASNDKTIRIWDTRTATCISELRGHAGRVNSVGFAPNGIHIVSGSEDSSAIIWDVESGQIVASRPCGSSDHNPVWSTTFSFDRMHVLSSGWDRAIRIWNVESGQAVCKPLFGHFGDVNSLAISAVDGRVFSVSDDETVRVWDVGNILKQSHSEDHNEADQRRIDTQDWVLGDNGWILGGHEGSDLLIWMPPDLRPALLRPRNTVIFNRSFSTELDFRDVCIGEHWMECLKPLHDL